MKTIIEMTRELGGFALTTKFLEAFAELVRADEREACAKVCDELAALRIRGYCDSEALGAEDCAVAIRARGNT